MSKKLFLLLVTMFAMVVYVNAQEDEEVEQAATAETEEVAPGNTKEANAEIKEINTEEKAKEKQADANIKDEGQKEVAKEIAEDKAAGKEEAAIEGEEAEKEAEKIAGEPTIEKKEKSGSWFSWLWPFSSSKETASENDNVDANNDAVVEEEAVAVENAPVEEAIVAEDAPVVAEEAVVAEDAPVVAEEAVVAEDAKGDEEVEAVEEVPVEEAVEKVVVEQPEPPEPKVDENAGKEKGDSFLRVAMLYIPNIFLNLSDVFTAGVAAGSEAGVSVRLTRYCQLGGQYGEAYFVEKGYDRRFGGGYDNGYSFGLFPLAAEKRYVDNTFGSVKEFIMNNSKAKIFSPEDPIYKTKKRDFWAIGVDAGWLINFRVDFHPVEFADFLASLIALDITGDNLK